MPYNTLTNEFKCLNCGFKMKMKSQDDEYVDRM
ncbi:MAG: hypothetical protein BWY47_00148 [Bacteroidetes bacterium ADurb.Bin302]|nr:MAG: hypothetical protein BWY47_00148 [Bacteroidetes bacterium ADurb.Bin302]